MNKKTLLNFWLLLLCMIVGGASFAWADANERTITISYNSSFGTALPTTSGSVHSTSTANTVEGLAIKEQGIYKGGSNNYLMFVENKGFLYNTADLGTVNSVAASYSSGTSTKGKAFVYFGTSEQSTYTTSSNATIKGQSETDTWTNSTSGKGFFQLSTSNKNVQITQIVIKYTPPAAPSFDIAAGTFNAAFDLTITAATGRTLKYTTDGTDPSSSNTATAVNSNSTTIFIPAENTRVRAISIKDNITSLEADATYTYIDASAPDATVSKSALDFGEVEVGQTKNLTFTVTPANLTGALSITYDNDKYTVSPTSIAQDATGAQTITVTAAPDAWNNDMDGIITISGGGLAVAKKVTLSTSPYQVSSVTLSATNGVIQESGVTKTSITSRVGNTVTLSAVANSEYMFDGWTATGATPASSNTAETKFTLTGTEVTLTAAFIIDPRKYTTLDDETIPAPSSNVNYGTSQTFVKDGLTWVTTAYQPKGYKALQLNNTNGYIKLPDFSGKIVSLTFNVSSANGTKKNDTSNKTDRNLKFLTSDASDATPVITSTNGSTNVITLDLTSLKDDYNTGYIRSSAALRIWEIAVVYIPTDIKVSISSAKYATFCDHVARDFSSTDINVYTAVVDGAKVMLTQVEDGIVPANAGVILYSSSVLNNVAIPETRKDADDYNGLTNELIGINVRTKVYQTASTKTNYILSNEAAGIGFYLAADDGAYLPAHRAYLSTVEAGAARSFLGFDDGVVTGVSDVRSKIANESGIIYDLQGRKVTQPKKGSLYIMNGKKVIFK